MDWIKLEIFTSSAGVDVLTNKLVMQDISQFEIEDPRDFEDFLTKEDFYYDYIDENLMKRRDSVSNIKLYFPENEQGEKQINITCELVKQLGNEDKTKEYGSLKIITSKVREEDWANNWKVYFKPFTIGEKLVIKPSWEDYDNKDNRIILEIDPESSFGSGQHHTTKLVLELMQDIVDENSEVLDMGCGSGILGVGAMLLGAKNCTSIDIDLNSIKVTRQNFGKNHIDMDKINAYQANVLQQDDEAKRLVGKNFNVIFANIVADVIMPMSPLFSDILKEGDDLITSGIISSRGDEVIKVLEKNNFKIITIREESEWIAIHAKKKCGI